VKGGQPVASVPRGGTIIIWLQFFPDGSLETPTKRATMPSIWPIKRLHCTETCGSL